MIKIYHNQRCSKSRNTLKLIEEKSSDIEVIDYQSNPPTRLELEEILKMLDLKPLELVRKGESIFKENYNGKELSDSEWIDVMIQNPKLIERPIVLNNSKAIIGRPPENVLDIL